MYLCYSDLQWTVALNFQVLPSFTLEFKALQVLSGAVYSILFSAVRIPAKALLLFCLYIYGMLSHIVFTLLFGRASR
jgi:hypothetical protein